MIVERPSLAKRFLNSKALPAGLLLLGMGFGAVFLLMGLPHSGLGDMIAGTSQFVAICGFVSALILACGNLLRAFSQQSFSKFNLIDLVVALAIVGGGIWFAIYFLMISVL